MNIKQQKIAKRAKTSKVSETSTSNVQFEKWPALPFEGWRPTCETLHLWTQIVGKVRLEASPFVNHWWQVPLYVTTHGLTTSPIPYQDGIFEMTFDFINQRLLLETSLGTSREIPLVPQSVASFYHAVMAMLQELDIQVRINTLPQEIKDPTRFPDDTQHASYDPVFARRFWQILIQTESVMRRYRSIFIGKSSPIHFFWGSFDLALTFFNGKRAPAKPDADPITCEAYSHEVISAGFWPGNADFPHPAFYSYTIPTPSDLASATVQPPAATYNTDLGEFILFYDDLRQTENPDDTLLAFFTSTYNAGADAAHWDRASLQRVSV